MHKMMDKNFDPYYIMNQLSTISYDIHTTDDRSLSVISNIFILNTQ